MTNMTAQETEDAKWIMQAFPDTRILGERPLVIYAFTDAEPGPVEVEIRPNGVVTICGDMDDDASLTPEMLRDLANQAEVAVALYAMWDASPSGQAWAVKYAKLLPVS
jgi:hypothetical protein